MRFPLLTTFKKTAFTPASYRFATTLLIALSLGGCSALPSLSTSNASANKASATEEQHQDKRGLIAPLDNQESDKQLNDKLSDGKEEALPSRPFSEQTLYNLLIAELATHEQNFSLAIDKYLLEAQSTRDSGLAAHATRLSVYGRDLDAALASARLWLETEPDSEKAAAIYADLLTQSDQVLHALDVLETQLKYSRKPKFGILSQATLAAGDRQLLQLLSRLDTLVKQYPNHVELTFTYALLLQQNNQHAEALTTLDLIKDHQTNPVQVALLKAQLLENLYDVETAANSLGKAIKKYPDERTLRLYYAKLLTRFDLDGAEKAFAYLLKDTPNNTDILFSHAIVAHQNTHYEIARRSFEKLISRNQHVTVSHYYLGLIDEYQDEVDAAIARFRQVTTGKYFMPATQRLINLQAEDGQLIEARRYLASLRIAIPLQAPNFWALEAALLKTHGHPQEASEILNLAIERFPEQLLLRLERALMSEQFNDFATTENDLRFILSRDPDNVTALNALGYTLSNHTERYNEALDLIKKALAIRPDDPAIIDSMGWVQYRLGQFKDAINNLEFAFEQFDDDEVAAHLIEVYWISGEKKKARSLIKKFKKQQEETPNVDEAINRLGIKY